MIASPVVMTNAEAGKSGQKKPPVNGGSDSLVFVFLGIYP